MQNDSKPINPNALLIYEELEKPNTPIEDYPPEIQVLLKAVLNAFKKMDLQQKIYKATNNSPALQPRDILDRQVRISEAKRIIEIKSNLDAGKINLADAFAAVAPALKEEEVGILLPMLKIFFNIRSSMLDSARANPEPDNLPSFLTFGGQKYKYIERPFSEARFKRRRVENEMINEIDISLIGLLEIRAEPVPERTVKNTLHSVNKFLSIV